MHHQALSAERGLRRHRRTEQAFGLVLRRHRVQKRLTQEQLAWTVHMSRVYISEMERGLREPSLTTLLRLAEAFETTAASLVAEIEQILRE
jgi:transcriptional regulator with XRE-family HTH domain